MDHNKENLLFNVGRSIRYHDRRVAHFEKMHQVSSVLTVLLAGSVILQVAGAKYEAPWWLLVISIAAALLSAIDVVIGYSKCASLHRDLKRRFCELESEIDIASTKAQRIAAANRRVMIEQHEPPIYRALDLLCHNEEMAAEGFPASHSGYARVGWLQRLTANYLRWADIGASDSELLNL